MTKEQKQCKILICNCENTMNLDATKLRTALDLDDAPTIHTHLCRSQIESYNSSLNSEDVLLVACTQEAPLFRELAEETGRPTPNFVNIRERAGWTSQENDVHPKIVSLLKEAQIPAHPAGLRAVTSEGICLVYGAGQNAIDIANELSERLSVSVVLTDSSDVLPPTVANVPIYSGRIRQVKGTIGDFDLIVDEYANMIPSSKDKLEFVMTRDGAQSKCDLIFDISGGSPLFSAHDRRDGYFFVDPTQPAAIARAMFQISDLVGEFEKPIYITYNETICAHGRSGLIGCSNCIDNCPVSAIEPDGDIVIVDNLVCGGCGNCSVSCPTGAISYDYPTRQELIERIQTLLSSYYDANGEGGVLLIHDESHGSELISALARFGRGLPVNVIPMSVYSPTQIGHEVLLSAFASGAIKVILLISPERQSENTELETQVQLANTFLKGMGYGENIAALVVEQDPDHLEELLYTPFPSIEPSVLEYQAVGGKRDVAHLMLSKLNDNAQNGLELLELPDQSPYGRIDIDNKKCTLCLACVGACPTGAISDNTEKPQLRFTEHACVQCGICRITCPENAIILKPQYNYLPSAMTPEVINEQEPFDCIRCGNSFGTKASVEHILAVLDGKHSMYKNSEQAKVIQMCDDCRIITLAESGDDPFKLGNRPKIRTTNDYIKEENEVADKTQTDQD